MSTPKPVSDKKTLTLKLVFPDREPTEVTGTSVKFMIRDNEKEKNGGLYGIHPGHCATVFALEQGRVEVLIDGKTVLKQTVGEGFAKVENDIVTLITSQVVKDIPLRSVRHKKSE